MHLHRFFMTAAVVVSCLVLPASGIAEEMAEKAAGEWHTGISLLGEPRHKGEFQHFDYVNPDAPKGGLVRLALPGSYDNFNIALNLVKGVAAAGVGALGGTGVYQSLMALSMDEEATVYGSIAKAVRFPADYSSATFRLNPKARWEDGQPVTPEDVVWSFEVQKQHNPQIGIYYRDVVSAQVSGPGEVTFTFSGRGNRELPQIVSQLPILPKHWWLASGPDGKPRDISQTSLEKPMGSGPYRVKSFEPGRSVTYERVRDWWGETEPFGRGHYNFDEVRYDYYINAQQMPDFFKADSYDFRFENSIANWMQLYNGDVPAIAQGRIVKQDFPARSVGRMQGFAFNLRRSKFQDIRVREAFNLVFDFEEMNRSLFFGQYTRIDSYFAGLDLAASGLPQGRERALLEELGDRVGPQIRTSAFANPVNGTDEARRDNQRRALALLRDAGWELRKGRLTSAASGEVMTVELLLDNPAFSRVALSYQHSLKKLGIDLAIRLVDDSQFQLRQNNRDFDMILYMRTQSASPGNEQRSFWGSAAAGQAGSQNIIGINDPAVDALVERIVYAADREELKASTRALDRVLLAGHYVVPMWYSPVWHTLRWDRFGQPARLPSQSPTGGFPDVWWYDGEKVAKTGAAR